jgi:hypothetical protein
MKIFFKKIFPFIFLFILVFSFSSVFAQNDPIILTPDENSTAIHNTCPEGEYCLLAPLPKFNTSIKTSDKSIGDYLSIIIKITIALAGVLAVVMLVIGGIEWMGSESVFAKDEGKSRIQNAIFGLLLAVGSYVILNTISPDLVNLSFGLQKEEIEIGDTNAPVPTTGTFEPQGFSCPGSGGASQIANSVSSIKGKVTYLMGGKGSAGPSGTVYFDCSGFVVKMLQCAGFSNIINGGTANIFGGAEAVTSITDTSVNNIGLNPGDLLGWKAGDGSQKTGHVIIYIGGGQFADSHGPEKKVGSALNTTPFSVSSWKHKSDIKYIKRYQ